MIAHVLPGLSAAAIWLGVSTTAAVASPASEPIATTATVTKLSPRSDGVVAAYSATYDGELTTHDVRLKAGGPLVRGDAFGLGALLGYRMTHLDLDTDGHDDRLDLHRFDAVLSSRVALAAGRSLRVALGTAYASDLRARTWSAMQLTSSAMMHWVLGPDDAIMFGAVYTSTAEFSPVLPILGYVHQRDGSRFRFDMFLPKHLRAEYALHPRVRGALGIEVAGYTWATRIMRSHVLTRRSGGDIFGELGFDLTRLMRLEARIGVSITRCTLPVADSDAMIERSLRPAGFAQLALLLTP